MLYVQKHMFILHRDNTENEMFDFNAFFPPAEIV